MTANETASKPLAEHHLAALAASGITPEHAALRGYETIQDPRRLEAIAIVKDGRRTRGLLIPSRRVDGSVWGYQYRPDSPRALKGRVIKYETPWQQRNGIDVPLGVGAMLGDPNMPLWITEGAKKADCAFLRGLACVSLPGVWSWLGKNPQGGKVAIPDWHDIALNDRQVNLAFDGDVSRKPEVRKALLALAGYLSNKGAHVKYLHLPDTDDKTGLDDYLADHTVEDLMRLVEPQPPQPTSDPAPEPEKPKNTAPLIGGDSLLNLTLEWYSRFIGADEDDLKLLALWTIHTHLAVECFTSPRIQIDSTTPGSGKTTVCEHMHRLACNAVHFGSVTSAALLVRILDGGIRTLLIDEADRSLSPDREGVKDLLGVINSGYKVGASRPVLVTGPGGKWTAEEMPTFAPVLLAGNSPSLPDDTRSRMIRILLMPDIDGLIEDTDWEYIEDEAKELHDMIAVYADSVRDRINRLPVDLPDGCRGRAREKWRPLKRVAVVAGGRWPDVVDSLIKRGLADDEADRIDGLRTVPPGLLIMQNLYEIWPADRQEHFVSTERLVASLIENHPEHWGAFSPYGKPLTDTRFGRMVRQASKVGSTRIGGVPPRGYTLASMQQAWHRLGIGRSRPRVEPDEPDGPGEPDGDTADPEQSGSSAPSGSSGSGRRWGNTSAATQSGQADDGQQTCTACGLPLGAAIPAGTTTHFDCQGSSA